MNHSFQLVFYWHASQESLQLGWVSHRRIIDTVQNCYRPDAIPASQSTMSKHRTVAFNWLYTNRVKLQTSHPHHLSITISMFPWNNHGYHITMTTIMFFFCCKNWTQVWCRTNTYFIYTNRTIVNYINTCFMALIWAAEPTLLTERPTLMAGRIPL